MSQITVLVVDDNRFARTMVSSIIQSAHPDWNIIIAEHGDDALEKAKDLSFNWMFLDYNMPGMNGLDLAEKLRDNHKGARICLLTANIQSTIQERADSLGVQFLSKPIQEKNILSVIDKAA